MREVGLDKLGGIGPKRRQALEEAGIRNVADLLRVLPRTYEDWSAVTPAALLVPGTTAVARLRVVSEPAVSYPRRGFSVVRATAEDATGRCALQWFNQPYMKNTVRRGEEYLFYGRVQEWKGKGLINPVTRSASEALPGLVPGYRPIGPVTPRLLRGYVQKAFTLVGEIPETLPPGWPERLGLMDYAEAVRTVHFPGDMDALKKAKERMVFEDLLLFQMAVETLRERRGRAKGRALPVDMARIGQKRESLPYPLTAAQERALFEILHDMQKPEVMARLVQGDVGSGKTVVALLCAYAAVCAGRQAAFMAPTELLARQHLHTAEAFFAGTGVRVEFLSGSMNAAAKREALARVASGEADVVVGTHALIQSGVEFAALGFAIADEQHRFGVMQRSALEQKGEMCDVLVMSATPIPRTLALILYADMDISVIDQLPPGRQPIKTRLVPPARREDMYAYVKEQAQKGAQAYVICPLVEESDELDVYSAEEVFEELENGPLKGIEVGLIHGRMRPVQKEEAMRAFKDGKTKVLVSTTVVEVGVDVPNATIIIIEDAERFGLAQLHQLRGRVGRGDKASYCFLLPHNAEPGATERLNVLVESGDGFEVARRDLEMRGPGEFLGTRQHGTLPWPGDRLCDMRLVSAAQAAARAILSLEEGDALRSRMTALCLERYSEFIGHSVFH